MQRRDPHGTLHRVDSNVAANVLHARDEHVSGVDKACCPENVSDYLHGSHLSPRQKSNLAQRLQLVLTLEIDGDTENEWCVDAGASIESRDFRPSWQLKADGPGWHGSAHMVERKSPPTFETTWLMLKWPFISILAVLLFITALGTIANAGKMV
jgi:hypothetical protein